MIEFYFPTRLPIQEIEVILLKAGHMKGKGVIRGHLFEKFVQSRFVSGPPERSMKLIDKLGNEKVLDIGSAFLKTERMTKKNLPDEFVLQKNICYATSDMEGPDVILSLEQEVYFIQCTVSSAFLSTKKSFYRSTHWKCVLLTPFYVKKLLTSNADLAQQFQEGNFYISDASHLLSDEQIELVKGSDKN